MLCKVTHCARHISANTRPHQLHWGDTRQSRIAVSLLHSSSVLSHLKHCIAELLLELVHIPHMYNIHCTYCIAHNVYVYRTISYVSIPYQLTEIIITKQRYTQYNRHLQCLFVAIAIGNK